MQYSKGTIAIAKKRCDSVNCSAVQCNAEVKSCDSVGSESGRCQQTPHTPHGLHAGRIAGDFGDDHDFQPGRFSTRMYDLV